MEEMCRWTSTHVLKSRMDKALLGSGPLMPKAQAGLPNGIEAGKRTENPFETRLSLSSRYPRGASSDGPYSFFSFTDGTARCQNQVI
jgi:hypothetical protein